MNYTHYPLTFQQMSYPGDVYPIWRSSFLSKLEFSFVSFLPLILVSEAIPYFAPYADISKYKRDERQVEYRQWIKRLKL